MPTGDVAVGAALGLLCSFALNGTLFTKVRPCCACAAPFWRASKDATAPRCSRDVLCECFVGRRLVAALPRAAHVARGASLHRHVLLHPSLPKAVAQRASRATASKKARQAKVVIAFEQTWCLPSQTPLPRDARRRLQHKTRLSPIPLSVKEARTRLVQLLAWPRAPSIKAPLPSPLGCHQPFRCLRAATDFHPSLRRRGASRRRYPVREVGRGRCEAAAFKQAGVEPFCRHHGDGRNCGLERPIVPGRALRPGGVPARESAVSGRRRARAEAVPGGGVQARGLSPAQGPYGLAARVRPASPPGREHGLQVRG
eukprot:scaffold645_cov247-Pinguiococcus_pyrenoidosus.AAC.31